MEKLGGDLDQEPGDNSVSNCDPVNVASLQLAEKVLQIHHKKRFAVAGTPGMIDGALSQILKERAPSLPAKPSGRFPKQRFPFASLLPHPRNRSSLR